MSGAPELQWKRFESGLGFRVHVTAAYNSLRPYLIGFYLALNKFRCTDGDLDGWKLADTPNMQAHQDTTFSETGDCLLDELVELVESAREDSVPATAAVHEDSSLDTGVDLPMRKHQIGAKCGLSRRDALGGLLVDRELWRGATTQALKQMKNKEVVVD